MRIAHCPRISLFAAFNSGSQIFEELMTGINAPEVLSQMTLPFSSIRK